MNRGLVVLFITGLLVVVVAANTHAAEAFTFKITVWAVDADSDMGKMKVKVTVKDKEHSFASDKGVTKSKTVKIGQQALYWDDSDFVVAKFDFSGVEKGDKYIACIAKSCHDLETIKSKKVTEKIRVG